MTREVTRKSVQCFLRHGKGKFGGVSNYNGRQNTTVENDTLYLFDNAIMKWKNGEIYFRLAGWLSNTTVERLSGLGLSISRCKGVASIKGETIDTYQWYPLRKFVCY